MINNQETVRDPTFLVSGPVPGLNFQTLYTQVYHIKEIKTTTES